MTRRLLLAALAALIAAPAAGEEASPRKLAVASISIIADFVRNVGGDRLEGKALVGAKIPATAAATAALSRRDRKPRDASNVSIVDDAIALPPRNFTRQLR